MLRHKLEELAGRFDVEAIPELAPPRFNVAPSRIVPVSARLVRRARWSAANRGWCRIGRKAQRRQQDDQRKIKNAGQQSFVQERADQEAMLDTPLLPSMHYVLQSRIAVMFCRA